MDLGNTRSAVRHLIGLLYHPRERCARFFKYCSSSEGEAGISSVSSAGGIAEKEKGSGAERSGRHAGIRVVPTERRE